MKRFRFRSLLPLAVLALGAASLFAPSAQAFPFECLFFPSHAGCPGAPVGPPPFIPVFENNTLYDGQGHSYELNTEYFASAVTAQEVCQRLHCWFVFEHQPCSMGGGPAACSGPERWLMFAANFSANAGNFARYWKLNNERDFPGVAQRLAELQLFTDMQSAGKPSARAPSAFLYAPIKGKRKR